MDGLRRAGISVSFFAGLFESFETGGHMTNSHKGEQVPSEGRMPLRGAARRKFVDPEMGERIEDAIDSLSIEVFQPPAAAGMDELRGVVSRVIHRSADGYSVYLVKDSRGIEHKITVTSSVVADKKDRILARGEWGSYKGAPSFKAATISHEIAPGARGIERWLKNKVVAGIGPAKIKVLVDSCGEDLPDLIGDADALMARITAAGKAKKFSRKEADKLAEAWNDNVGNADLSVYLGQFPVLGPALAYKIIKRYGAACRRIIEETPWKLAETIDGIGFEIADQIAFKAGHTPDSPARLDAGVRFTLEVSPRKGGHCALPRDVLVKESSKLLKVAAALVEKAVDRVIDTDAVVYEEDFGLIYSPQMHRAETALARRIVDMIREGSRVPEAVAQTAVDKAMNEIGVTLDKGQFAAAVMAVSSPVSIITGGPGTGKSTTQRVIVRALEIIEETYGLAAPTGRAAKRLSEVSERPASTCHRLLSFSAEKGGFEYDSSKPFEWKVMIVDEFSMVDLLLAQSFTDAIHRNGRLIIVGDVDQLESVGAGQVLRDLIASGVIPVAVLKTVHRQTGDSGIVVAANRINTGVYPLQDGEKLKGFYLSTKFDDFDEQRVLDTVVDLVARRMPAGGFDAMSDIQVLAPYRDGLLGVNTLNGALKAALNPARTDNSVEIRGRIFSVGDRVMHLRNDYTKKVYNGELGTVAWVGRKKNENGGEEPSMRVDYMGFQAFYGPKDVDDVELSWAATVHKSQGCEFPVVIVVVPASPRILLTRNLLYTAVTRARKECIVIGSRDSVAHAVNAVRTTHRHTGLARRLSPDYRAAA
jgi:exodeoxyribonuclease V alpha subunit